MADSDGSPLFSPKVTYPRCLADPLNYESPSFSVNKSLLFNEKRADRGKSQRHSSGGTRSPIGNNDVQQSEDAEPPISESSDVSESLQEQSDLEDMYQYRYADYTCGDIIDLSMAEGNLSLSSMPCRARQKGNIPRRKDWKHSAVFGEVKSAEREHIKDGGEQDVLCLFGEDLITFDPKDEPSERGESNEEKR
ncbi:MAG: hypothetical protein M1827_005435 [Pycnora praestabilis]|nr:MAG: hypothetical protein M1827_005435 [Pycnora praestabilis]